MIFIYRAKWLVIFLLVAFYGTSFAGSAESLWKVGRAKIEVKKEGGGQELILRLSLRNEGQPGKAHLEIKGQWTKGGNNKKPDNLKDLGSYTREVALKQTAILVISLDPLGSMPHGEALFLVVKTGPKETDSKVIALP